MPILYYCIYIYSGQYKHQVQSDTLHLIYIRMIYVNYKKSLMPIITSQSCLGLIPLVLMGNLHISLLIIAYKVFCLNNTKTKIYTFLQKFQNKSHLKGVIQISTDSIMSTHISTIGCIWTDILLPTLQCEGITLITTLLVV